MALRGLGMLASTGARRIVAVALVLFSAAAMAGPLLLVVRHEQERRGLCAIEPPGSTTVAYADDVPRRGRFQAEIEYTCFGARTRESSSLVLWDDGWFSADPYAYNHSLARAASVLSALAYSESAYYQGSSAGVPYMERAMRELGFDEVDTGSYRYRSEVVDEVLDVVTQDADGVAYTIARKRVPAQGDADRDLIAVSIRGSYGSEWLSNFNLTDAQAASTADELAAERAGDHSGYRTAALEILSELDGWIAESESRGSEVSILLTGHSRGGAVAGLLAAMLDDAAAEGRSSSDPRVYAYTFASPRTTASTRGNDRRYANIFNIVNPADIVTRVPLEDWGYIRYGVDVPLPGIGSERFDAYRGRMLDSYERITGSEDAYDADSALAIDAAVADMARDVPRPADLPTPRGVAAVAAACALRINPARILLGHYPSVYIAWMEALPGL